MSDSVERVAAVLGAGDPQQVRALIAAGADLHYRREHGYDALLDAVHGRDLARDPRLLDLLSLLIAHGVGVSGVSEHGESALRVLSRVGRFDAVRLLLDAGADRGLLGWTPLMEAVALGSAADVRAALAAGPALEGRDCWSRTAWHIAVLSGDVGKAKLLRDAGADTHARGHCGQPSLFYAVRGRRRDMLLWLLHEGADVDQADDFGATALIDAVERDDAEAVRILLDAGADVGVDAAGTALGRAHSRDVIRRLLDAGADPADLSCAGQRVLLGLPPAADDGLAAVPADAFRRTYARSFGTANPGRMHVPFWEAMVRCGVSAYEARRRFEDTPGLLPGPVWCDQRYGQSLTLLPDGRAVRIGGEHEDFYDPDFCIYNDVIVHDRDGSVAIYSYPEDVFPPTDFHTATPVGGAIIIIGSLGYAGTRRPGETPVYRLDVATLRMERLHPGGEAPGWIYKHQAAAGPDGIRVWGGRVVTRSDSGESHDPNAGCFVLDLDRLVWRCVSPDGPP